MSLRGALGLSLGLAAAAWASGDQHTQYQDNLLHRSLGSADQTYCSQRANGDSDAFTRCKVTRLFLEDIKRNADQGFPPMTDIRCVQSVDEKNKILDRLTRYGG